MSELLRLTWNILLGTAGLVALVISFWKLIRGDTAAWQTWSVIYLLLAAGVIQERKP